MNDNPSDPLDHLLAEAFAGRRGPVTGRPSLLDVQRRARRRQRRRVGSMAGALAVAGLGGVALLARPTPDGGRLAGDQAGAPDGLGEPATPTTTICLVTVQTTTPSETTSTAVTGTEVGGTSPTPAEATTTTTIDTVPCEPAPAVPLFRCVGQPLGGDGEWIYYEYCEPVDGPVPTTTIPPGATPAAEVTASTIEVAATTTSTQSAQP